MKILAFVDTHSDIEALRALAGRARKEKVDALICAGDISNFGIGLNQLVSILDIGVPLYIIPGNHETAAQVRTLEKKFDFVHDIHLKSKKIDNLLIIGCGGGGFSPFNTPFEKSESKFAEELRKFKDQKTRKCILVSHAPPYDTHLDELYNEHSGVRSISQFIQKEQPDLCICGHFHENAGKKDKLGKTKIINPGTKGAILEI